MYLQSQHTPTMCTSDSINEIVVVHRLENYPQESVPETSRQSEEIERLRDKNARLKEQLTALHQVEALKKEPVRMPTHCSSSSTHAPQDLVQREESAEVLSEEVIKVVILFRRK